MPASDDPRAVPADACEIARRLAAMFEHDRELALALNEAQKRLLDAADQLTAGLSAEALRAIYGPPGPDLALSGHMPPVLEDPQPIGALEMEAQTIRSAFLDYQQRAEDRRVLGFDVGEANAELVAAMVDAGFSVEEARNADVQALAGGIYRPADVEATPSAEPPPPRRSDFGIGGL